MSYIDDQLLPGEQVKYEAHLHKIIYALPGLLAVVMTLLALLTGLAADLPWLGVVLFVTGILPLVWTHITYTTSEFAVTDKRVIIKVGWIRRRTLETMLAKVEAIGVDQGIFGRMLGFGTITVTGTGGTREAFPNIGRPLEFRRQVQGQVSDADAAHRTAPAAAASAAPSAPQPAREERDCPYCAERILARARVCKHCGRDVEPLVRDA
jgi:uncharacterized membrane protein YdbT with pleckstrin-like domain